MCVSGVGRRALGQRTACGRRVRVAPTRMDVVRSGCRHLGRLAQTGDGAVRCAPPSHPKHLHRNPLPPRPPKRPRRIAVQRPPCVRVDLRLQRRLQRAVRVVGAEEVGVADEERFLVVVRVDEPAGDAVGAGVDDFAGLGLEDVDAVDLDAEAVVGVVQQGDVGRPGSPKMTKRLPLPVFFRPSAMWRSAFIRALRIGMRPRLVRPVQRAS